jgi:hypothetical protein
LTGNTPQLLMLCDFVIFQMILGRTNLFANVALKSFWIGVEIQMFVENCFSGEFVTANIAFECFQVGHLMISMQFIRLECLVAGFTLEDFSCHVPLHVSHQMIFVLEQETAVITLQEFRMKLHMTFEIWFQVEIFEAKLAPVLSPSACDGIDVSED